MKIEVIVEDATPLGYSLGVRGTYHGLSNPQIPVSLSTRATLSPGTSLLIFGLVGLPEEGEEVTPPPSSPLVILDSMDFAQKLSEFVIVIQMR
ncbi:MAG: hypothetical protein KDD22_06920 [Bdellovibrionales bacterium]|nr:hypothetical protein [Bdellovibrionales bacterium]